MKLEYDQWLDMLANDEKLKEDWVDKLWKDLTARRKQISKDIFDLFYANRYLNFAHEDRDLHFAVSEDKVKAWNKRHYRNNDTYVFVDRLVPQLFKQKNITRYTVEKIAWVLKGMLYCDDVLSRRAVQSRPLETKTTQEILNEKKRITWVQLEIPFDYDEPEENTITDKVEESAEDDSSKGKWPTEEELEELYKYDPNEPWHQRI